MQADERQLVDVHIKVCDSCQEDVRNFLALREQIDEETKPSLTPNALETRRERQPFFAWRRRLAWTPAYTAAAVLIGIALVLGIAVLLKRRVGNLEVVQTHRPQINIGPAKQTPTPESQAVNVQPTPAPVPSEQLPRHELSPSLTVKNREPKPLGNADAVAVLKDESGTVRVDKSGNVSGLDGIPQNTRQEIGETLLAENIKAPATQAELAGGPIVLRGPNNSPTFKLRSPARTVVISDRPSFEWEQLAGATSYRVSVGDLKGHEIAKSEELPADQARWTTPTSLKRGEIYVWEVEAMLDGKKIVSPGTSSPQMKFKVLSASSTQELGQLKNARSRLALGVFYAREGMVAEAEHEFQILTRENPRSRLLEKLLKQVQSWHQRSK
jgi:hypothetical protein